MDDDGWILEPAPWAELTRLRRSRDEPVLEASWHDAPVVVVAPDVVEEWAATAQVLVLSAAHRTTHAVDLPATFEAEGLPTENALVVRNCAAIQIGNRNTQTTVHRFRVEDVRITLDRVLARQLAADVSAGPAADGYTKVSIWNSRGVQVGDFNRQRTVFRHVVTGPELELGPADRQVVDLVRAGRLDAAERELVRLARTRLEADAAPLYDALEVTSNENLPSPPPVLEDTIASAYGQDNTQKIREHIDVVDVVLTELLGFTDPDGARGALKRLPEPEPPTIEPPEPEPPKPPTLPSPWSFF
ncbi:hypothetical protein M8542_12565 [Amycolatopsis sp. OK19-0408]|uniref:Uncharacterized protein n=1 Tax=Amycolatopsis iheyensis TaxID=2945988 RepID=A0A9X2NAL9_9PSEU|nr:RIP homotypic interaction motif-containing protein [Amycolatopsis iheyensis]MCR6483651.1 hypothetical protein [Amycolatopsis iheyensis]